ncbi:MAG: macrolide family glycosyltransferase [Angelakisella sp.]|nr:macrolide family glycosyltransferase [Angelakisella sp.]
MSKIVFFCIYAHGHTNPTIEVVRELTRRGHEVWYYSFDEFREKIEGAGAKFISCNAFLPPAPADLEKKIGRDFVSLIEMTVDTTLALEPVVCPALQEFKPDCIVSDSICLWGKLFAAKLQVPLVCSTTTFAFNQYTARLMKRSLKELFLIILGMPKIKKKMQQLTEHGYPEDNFINLIQNDNTTNTIVYTSKEFQPLADTFSDKYSFVGPSVAVKHNTNAAKSRPLVYISLGTVLNKNSRFYQNCIEALKNTDMDVVMSVGPQTDIAALGAIPANFVINPHVDQIEVLQTADVFVTHCGMNSVNESIYCSVPMVLFPQHSEEGLVAQRTQQLGAGMMLRNTKPQTIADAVGQVLRQDTYRQATAAIAATFRQTGGANAAASAIEKVINNK